MRAAVTPAGVRDGAPAALAGVCAARGPSVVAYCRHVAGDAAARAAAADAFARFRAAVVATDELAELNPEALLVNATRHAAASHAARGEHGACADVPALLAARAGKTIAADDLERLERHLAACPRCHEPVARFEAAERAYRDPPDPAMDLTTAAQIIAAMVAAVPPRDACEPPRAPAANGNGHPAALVVSVPAAPDAPSQAAETRPLDATAPEAGESPHADATAPEATETPRVDATAAEATETPQPDATAPEATETPHVDATVAQIADEPVTAPDGDEPLAEPTAALHAPAAPQTQPDVAADPEAPVAPPQTAQPAVTAAPAQPAPQPKSRRLSRRPRGAARAAVGARLPRPQRPPASQTAMQAHGPRRGRGHARRARPLAVVLPVAVVLVALLAALMVSGVVGGSDPASSPRVDVPTDAPAAPAAPADVVVVPGAKEASADEIEKAKARERERAKRRRDAAVAGSSSPPAPAARPVTAPPAAAAAPPPPPPAADTRQDRAGDSGTSPRVDAGNGATGAEQIPSAEDTSEVPDLAPPPEPATAP